MAAECIPVLIEVAKCLIGPLWRQLGYLVYSKENLEDLRKKLNDLDTKKTGVDRLVLAARRSGDLIKPTVEEWLAKVENTQKELRQLLHVEEQEMGRCLKGCSTRYRLGKESITKLDDINKLLDEGKGFNCSGDVSDPAPLPTMEYFPTADFQSFASRESTTNQILEALKNEKIYLVGVYGMDGIGKTTLMTEIGKRLLSEQHFKDVALVKTPMSPRPDEGKIKIQDDIAEILGMKKMEGKNVTARAILLSSSLKKREGRVLVILDNLLERLDLAIVGIPLRDNCKVVIITSSQNVCNQMDTQKDIKVGELSHGDSWDLFRCKVGDVVESPSFDALAKEVVNECKGVPLALVTVGRDLRGKEPNLWSGAAQQLKKFTAELGMSPGLASIKLSYDSSRKEEIKRSFFLRRLIIEDPIFVEEDLCRAMGEDLLGYVGNMEVASDRFLLFIIIFLLSFLILQDKQQISLWIGN